MIRMSIALVITTMVTVVVVVIRIIIIKLHTSIEINKYKLIIALFRSDQVTPPPAF